MDFWSMTDLAIEMMLGLRPYLGSECCSYYRTSFARKDSAVESHSKLVHKTMFLVVNLSFL